MSKYALAPLLSAGLACLCVSTVFAQQSGQPDARRGGGPPVLRVGVPDQPGGHATTHILVRFAPDVRPLPRAGGGVQIDRGPVDAAAQAWGVTGAEQLFQNAPKNQRLARQYGLTRTFKLRVPQGTNTPQMAAAFSALPGVELAEVDGVGGIAQLPNDPSFSSQWNFHNTGQGGGTADADVDAPEAWDVATGSSEIVVAVIDTGVQANHPDLIGRVVSGYNTYDENTNTDDTHGHGTHVTGIVGANTNNGVGVAGVNWSVTILAMRCLTPSGSGFESDCAEAVVWATDYGCDVANMSLQFFQGTTVLRDAVAYAYDNGVLPVAAAGNNARSPVEFPARFPKCMAVTATNRNDGFGSFSNFGEHVDLSAPGAAVYSLTRNSSYGLMTGTSMATPHVSGAAALLLSVRCNLEPPDLEYLLRLGVDDLGPPGWDELFGWGRLNLHKAVLAVGAEFTAGDMNCDGSINGFDIEGFVQAMADPGGYAGQYPDCHVLNADINCDGSVNQFDLQPFVELLTP